MGNFSMLPSEIILDILTRLPTESVLDCKSVSKAWNTVIQHPSFSQLHLNHLDSADSGNPSFIFLSTDEGIGSRQFYYVEYDENSSHRVTRMSLNPLFRFYSLVGSSNGLVCLNVLPAHYTLDESDRGSYVAYICNPVTGEFVMLPELERRSIWDDAVDFIFTGFGYVSKTNEYKVVRLYKFEREPEFAEIEVYTLGGGEGWRNEGKKIDIGSETWKHGLGVWQHGVFANGCVNFYFGKGKIVAFDLADEVFVELSEITELKEIEDSFWSRRIRLGVLEDCLRAIHYTNTKSSDVWLFKKKQDESLMSWSKGFSLTYMDGDGYNNPLALTSGGRVLCRSSTKLRLYDLKSSSTKLLADFDRSIYEAIPHRNTLLSLIALGERTQQTLEAGESAIEDQKGRDWPMKQQ